MKKLISSGLSLVLAAVLCFSLLPVTASAEWVREEKGDFLISSNAELGRYNVLGFYNGEGGDVVIPEGVTEIGGGAFGDSAGGKNVTSIKMPDTVTKIGENAFAECRNLASVTIPNSVTEIGELAFFGCSSLVSVILPDNLKSMGHSTFSGCNSLTSITIPDSLTSIGETAFWACTSLTSITIPDSVTSIGTNAFGLVDGLTIKGVAGSAAEKHATQFGIKFEAISGTTPVDPTKPTLDLTGASTWAHDGISNAVAADLVPQDLQSAYTQATTRAEFAALAVQLYETVTGAEIAERQTFSDTTDINVEKAAAIGIVNGVGDNKFDPNTGLTREQAATMLSRLADAIGKPIDKQAATFADNGGISSWAIEAVGQMQTTGIMGGVGNNIFDPQGAYTREQSIVTILRLYDIVK